MWIPKIVVVEDEFDSAEMLKSFLGRRGYIVSTVTNGREGLKLISSIRPELVLLDMTLEGMSGLELLRELRKSDPVTQVIILSGQVFDQVQLAEIMNLGVIDVLSKPVSLQRLEILVAQMIRGSFFTGGRSQPMDPTFVTPDLHKISNLLGVIRNLCEAYILDSHEGFHREKTPEQLQVESLHVMKIIMENVDQISERLGKGGQVIKETGEVNYGR